MLHTALPEDILAGKVTDVYFQRTRQILEKLGRPARVVAEFIKRNSRPFVWTRPATVAATDVNGHFEIFNLAAGKYNLRFSMTGYKEKIISDIAVAAGETKKLDIALEETAIEIGEVTVTPKPEKYDATGITARLGRKTVVEAPGSAQDIFWVIQTLPGIPSDVDNSTIYVRGGRPDENLVLLDGATIKNPFHRAAFGRVVGAWR